MKIIVPIKYLRKRKTRTDCFKKENIIIQRQTMRKEKLVQFCNI